jgi:hypothetical protein
MTAALQLVFIALSVAGWIAWRRSMRASEGSAPTASPAGSALEMA